MCTLQMICEVKKHVCKANISFGMKTAKKKKTKHYVTICVYMYLISNNKINTYYI